MVTSTGTISFGITKACEYPGCFEEFIPRTIQGKYCNDHRGKNSGREAQRAIWSPEFIAIDGEGVGRGSDHEYVLLGVGDEQIEWPTGVKDISEIFTFLYGQFLQHPNAAFVGFYLGYDFNMWLRLLPRNRAWYLLTDAGQLARKRKCKCVRKICNHSRLPPHPVEYKGWQFDILGFKRFKLRPKRCECPTVTCDCKQQAKWMHINDAGPFFQASLLTVIDPKEWREPIIDDATYDLVKAGKDKRATAQLDDDMRLYNRIENRILADLMGRLNTGFVAAGVKLNKRQWFGPGQAAQAWMRLENKLGVTTTAVERMSRHIRDAARATYYGGWFEIPIHGYIPGVTYEYDINSAYPTIAAQLPCLCGTWKSGRNSPPSSRTKKGHLRMCHVIVTGKDKHLGPLPYRTRLGGILRPRNVQGWYWQHEINAARRAGLIDQVDYIEWHEYVPCHHAPPLRGLVGLYEGRQRIGKDTPEGKAYKLVYNSVYGKLAQSLGEPVYANPVYASLITSGCRTMILNAIATHPGGSSAVAMVATDGVYFLTPHPSLPVSERLGDWDTAEKRGLTVFKPGVYWDDKARDAIKAGKAPRFKARGINARDFAESIDRIDAEFMAWDTAGLMAWPSVEFKSRFTQISVLQALQWSEGQTDPKLRNWRYTRDAGRIIEDQTLTQNSDPKDKRNPRCTFDGRVWRSEPWDGKGWPESTPYEKSFGFEQDLAEWNSYATPDGPVMLGFRKALGVG